ncbi:MAG: hypothetical protein RL106_1842 [Bacteroidota bacterium]|jgi:hypothetical protein
MSSIGTMGEFISLETASAWTARYRATISEGDTIASAVSKEIVMDILQQEGCVGIRFYYGIDDDNATVLIAVGVDANGDDLYKGLIADRFGRCPDVCPSFNPLNSNN